MTKKTTTTPGRYATRVKKLKRSAQYDKMVLAGHLLITLSPISNAILFLVSEGDKARAKTLAAALTVIKQLTSKWSAED